MLQGNKKLVKDIKAVMLDLESMIDNVKGKTSKEIASQHTNLMDKLSILKGQLIISESDLVAKEQLAVKMTNEYVHSYPWKIAFIAVLFGFFIGYFM